MSFTLNVAKKITTLYIDDNSIRLMVTRGKRIIKLAEAPLDMNLSDISVKVKEAELVTKIKHLLKNNNIKTKKVIVGVSGLHCLSRPTALPQLPNAMLDEAMTREAKRIMPVPLEQLYISWQVLKVAEGKMQTFIVAVPRQIADNLLSVLHQVGLKPYLMDIKPLALARLIGEPTALVVDVQPREFDIVVVADGVPQPIRTVPLPQDALSLPEKLLIIRDELKRTVQFHNSNNPERPIQPDAAMYVSGELADEPEVHESLANELGYRVIPLASPLKCPKQLDPAQYMVNIGLALKELAKEAGPLVPNVNALPVPYQPKQLSWRRVMVLPVSACAIGLLALLVIIMQDAAASIDSTQSQLEATNFALDQRLSQKDEMTEKVAALEQKLADARAAYKTFTATIQGLNEQGDVVNGNLVATVDNLVYGIELNAIEHSDRGLSLRGRAPSEVEIMAYARNMDATGNFSEVTLSNMRRVDAKSGEAVGEEIEGEEIEGEEIEGEGEEIEGEAEEVEVEIASSEDTGMEFTLLLKLKETEE